MKRRNQSQEEKEVTYRAGKRTPLVTTKKDIPDDQNEPMLPENDVFNDMPNEYNQQPGSGGLIGGERGEQEYGLRGPVVKSEEKTAKPEAEISGEGPQAVLPEVEPQPYGELDETFGGVSEYTAENAGKEEKTIGETETRQSEESEIDREDREVLFKLARRLRQRKEIDLSQVSLHIDHGNLIISGKVDSEFEKSNIREVAEAIPGVRTVDDRLEVAPKAG